MKCAHGCMSCMSDKIIGTLNEVEQHGFGSKLMIQHKCWNRKGASTNSVRKVGHMALYKMSWNAGALRWTLTGSKGP